MKVHCYFLVIVFALSVKLHACEGANKYTYNLSTHVLDTGKGRPAANVPVTLYKLKNNDDFVVVGQGLTENNGRFANFASNTEDFTPGTYKLTFAIKKYHSYTNEKTFYPVIDIVFNVDNSNEHYHIPLLLNAYGYTTYRGS